jgi:DNA-binding GntR family transcriptional regulator
MKRESLMERAYEAISARIISMQFEPGTRLDQAWLERELGLGRTPIREALFKLSAENLVEVSHNRGFTVKPLSLKEVSDLFEALLVAERFSGRLASHRMTRARLQALESRYRRIQAAVDRQDYLRITVENALFHREIAAASDNQFVRIFVESLQNQAQRLAYISFSRTLSREMTLKDHFSRAQWDHQQIIRCLADGDADGVEKVIFAHILLFRGRIQAFLESTIAEDLVLPDNTWTVSDGRGLARISTGK